MLGRVLGTVYYLRALRSSRGGRHAAALAQLNEAIRYLPFWPHAYCNRAFAHQGVGDHQSAIQDCDRAIRLAPNLAMAFYNRGISEKALLDFNSALADQSRAITLDPNLAGAHAELGVVYACKHEHDLAIASLTKAIGLNPANAGHYLRERGFCRFHRGDFAEAAADLQQSLASEPDPYAMLAYHLARARVGADARRELEADARALDVKDWPYPVIELFLGARTPYATLAAAPNPDARAEACFYVGEWHLLRGNRADAEAGLQQAARTCPANYLEYAGAIAELRRLAAQAR